APQAAPAAQPAPAPQATPVAQASVPQAAPAQPAAATPPRRAEDPKSAPVDASGFSSGASAFAPGTQPVAPLVVDQRQAFGRPAQAAGGRSPWILVPLGLVGLVLLSVSGASVVRQTRSQGVRAPI
ncbi:MAG: hypothetical protein M3137_11800, partial [Actinomycetota bacterium]|nr:hypothetical protein [Actinomycetota bacterium]